MFSQLPCLSLDLLLLTVGFLLVGREVSAAGSWGFGAETAFSWGCHKAAGLNHVPGVLCGYCCCLVSTAAAAVR